MGSLRYAVQSVLCGKTAQNMKSVYTEHATALACYSINNREREAGRRRDSSAEINLVRAMISSARTTTAAAAAAVLFAILMNGALSCVAGTTILSTTRHDTD